MTDVSSPASKRRRAPRWMWILLVVSLALNLVIAGMGLAAVYHWRMTHGGPGAGFSRFVETLPQARQQELRSLVDERAAIGPLRRKAWRARREARRIFAAEPFDSRQLEEAYSNASAAHEAHNRARGAWFMKMATKLTAEERRSYLKWRSRQHRHFRRRHRDERSE